MRKTGRIITNLILIILTTAALAIVLPNIFGIKTMAVLSGSMEPAYPTGSMVYAQPVSMEDIQKGDVISFALNSRGTVATHRVVEVDKENKLFTVKGDANQANDANPVSYENVIGVVKFSVPMMGYILGFVITTSGKIIAGTVIIAAVILILLFSKSEEQEEKKKKKYVYSQDRRYTPRHK